MAVGKASEVLLVHGSTAELYGQGWAVVHMGMSAHEAHAYCYTRQMLHPLGMGLCHHLQGFLRFHGCSGSPALPHIVTVALDQKRLHTDEVVGFCNVLLAVILMCDPYCGSEYVCLDLSRKTDLRSQFHCRNLGNSADYGSRIRGNFNNETDALQLHF